MATPTYDLIDSQVLSTSAASVSFTSIPATYRDLVLVMEVIPSSTGYSFLQANGDSANNYSIVYMRGNGSAASSGAYAMPSFYDYPVMTSGRRILLIAQFMDYSATDKHKTVLTRANDAAGEVTATAGRWANTAAINQITFVDDISAGSTFYLYGIAS